eukprot:7174183-Prymnesium_polylepis.1
MSSSSSRRHSVTVASFSSASNDHLTLNSVHSHNLACASRSAAGARGYSPRPTCPRAPRRAAAGRARPAPSTGRRARASRRTDRQPA